MKNQKWKPSKVLVTGASSGLGREIARALARRYWLHLVITATEEAPLEELAEELRREHGAMVTVVVADLRNQTDMGRLVNIAVSGEPLSAAILNAGVTYYGAHADITEQKLDELLQVNVHAVAWLATALLPYLDQQRGSALMLISSMAGKLSLPYQALYSATKSFVTSLGKALAGERNGNGASITVFTPGGINTRMLRRSGLGKLFKPGSIGMMEADVCARLAVQAMVDRKGVFVPDWFNRVGYAIDCLARLSPRASRFVRECLRQTYEPPN